MRVFDSTEATQYELQACLKVLKSMGLLLNYDYMGRCKESFVKSELGPAQEREREREPWSLKLWATSLPQAINSIKAS